MLQANSPKNLGKREADPRLGAMKGFPQSCSKISDNGEDDGICFLEIRGYPLDLYPSYLYHLQPLQVAIAANPS